MVHRHFSTRRTLARAQRSKVIALTFDDGPSAELTPALLELLARHKVSATFFPSGARAERNPGLLPRLLEHGHEVGSHGYEHHHAWRQPVRAMQDIMSEAWAPPEVRAPAALVRPPFGKMHLATWALCLLRRRRLAWWTDDSKDTADTIPSTDERVRASLARGGGVVLLHDHHDSEARAAYVLAFTEKLILEAHSLGIRVGRYSDV